MALTMPAKTWEKGGSGNASTASSSANSFTITKDNPLYEASLRLEKKKAEAAAKQLEEDKRKKYEEDKVKAKYYADNIQPFVKTLNDVVNQTGGFFDKWRNQNESNYTQGLYTSLNGHYTKLRDSVTDNSYLKDVLSEDEYIRLEREVNAIGKSIDDAISGVKSASDVYAQYGNADDYDRHLRLSGMSSDELQKQIDDLDKKSDYMSKLDSSYDTIKVMGDDVLKPTKEYDDFRKKTESDRVELTSYLNNAKYNEESAKYGVDPKSMTYEEITALLNDGNLSRKQPEKYDFIKRYYDSMSNADWQMKRSEEFVNGLDTVDRDWLKKAADAVDVVVSTSTDSHATSEAGHALKRAYEVLGNKNGWSEEEIRDNIDLAKLYLDAEEREDSKKAISEKFAKSSVLSPIVSNAASVLANIPGSLMSLGDSVYQSIYNKYTGNNLPINTNTNSSDLLNLTNDIREATREEIEKKTTAKLPNGKNLGVFAYDTLMTIADVATATAIGGLSAAGKGLSAKEMGKAIGRVSGMISSSTAAANKVQESIEAGDSNGIAIAKGAIVGAIEAITERIQIDNLVDAIVKGDKAITTVLRGALSEGTEEVVSDILAEDLMELAFGNGTRLKRFYDDYVNQGYSKKKAYSQAILDIVGQEAETFVSAAIAGAAFGGITAVTTRANDKATAKMTQDAVANEVSGIGEINFLRGINRIMDAAEESPNDAGVAQAAQKINDRITFLESVKKKLADNGSLKRVVGENGVQAEIAKVDAVEQELKGTLDIIRDVSYDATTQDYLITERENALKADAESTAMSEGRIRAAAQRYVASVGSIKKAVSDLVKTKNNIDTDTANLQQEKKTLQESIRAGKADATAKQRIREINASIKKNTRDADRAQKLTDVLTGNQTEFLNNALGADQKRISKALSDASGRNVSVQYDSTMGENEMAAMRSRGGASTLVLNPERILRAQAELEAMGESGVNVARGKVVHEAGHLAARTDGTFVPKVYEVYASLRDSKVIPTYAVNEADIKAGYGESVAAFLKTKFALEEKNDLVANKGMSEEEATRLLEERYMQEEYVMHFLEYMENNGANLYNTIVPEKRNAFVEAMRKIAQFFRDIAAKIRGKDPASAKKMESLADKLYNAVADFAGGSMAAQESVNAKTTENTTATESGVPEGSTGTQEADERKSLDVNSMSEESRDNIGEQVLDSEAAESMTNEEAFEDSEVAVRYSIRPPYSDGSKAFNEFSESLSPEARKTFDMFYGFYQRSRITNALSVSGKRVKGVNISSLYLRAQEWNDMLQADEKWRAAAQDLADFLPKEVRERMRMNPDGTLNPNPLEEEFKMPSSLAQRLVDSLPYEMIDAEYKLGGKTITLPEGKARQSVGGEAYRRAIIDETRKLYESGKLKQVGIGTMSKDRWGSLGFLAANGKTGASGDFTTVCPQMMFNRGCWYCYRRAAMEKGVNNKLVANNVWYTGEILRVKDSDIKQLNENGGLRIQSFGDWMPHFSAMLADVLYDAEMRGLQVKIITKEPSMINYIAAIREQGVGKNLYFNLSADYTIEEASPGTGELDAVNPERPFQRRDSGFWWKRAMTVEEAAKYREKYPWVNTRIVATDLGEFIRGLKDPRVDVVTGYHGNIREFERVDSTTGEHKVMVEALGDAGMPRFAYNPATNEWVTEYEGKTQTHKKLAEAIASEGLQMEYYTKTCCITGRCATCKGKCGALARDFNVKNATNRDEESVAYWRKEMQYAIEPEFGDMTESETRFSLNVVTPVTSSDTKSWRPGHAEEWFNEHGLTVREDVSEAWLEARKKKGWKEGKKSLREKGFDGESKQVGTQISTTEITYARIFDYLKSEYPDTWQDIRVLDASSGLGLGTKTGLEAGFDVTDIEPYVHPDSDYFPDYMDYSSLERLVLNGEVEPFDFIISNAVLNVIPQDTRDNMVAWFDNVLAPGGQLYVNTLDANYTKSVTDEVAKYKNGKVTNKVLTDAGDYTDKNHIIGNEIYVGGSQSVQKGFSPNELKAYLRDALGDGYTVETPKFKAGSGAVAIATKNADNIDTDERKSIATGSSIYIKDGHTADGETVDFVNLILDGKKKGETRTHKSLTRKWVGIAKDGYVYGRVRFGEPYLIDKDSPEYADSYIEGTEYDIADGEQKYYYPILEVEDFRDAPKPITKHGNYAQYEYEDGEEDYGSDRFNTENDDIRYSKETSESRTERLKEDKAFLKAQMDKTRSVALSPAAVDNIVKEMREQYGFDTSERDNVKKMLELIDKVVNKKIKSERMDEVWDSLTRGARSILEGVYEVDASLMKENEEFIKYIRSTTLSVPEKNESDLAGGYAEYKNDNRKYVNLSRNGTPVETVYAAICEQYPGMLDPTVTNPAYMIDEIVRAMKALEPVDVPSYAGTMDQAAQEFAHVLGVKYMNTAQKTYFSDVHDEVSKLKRENRQNVTAYEARLRSIESAAARDAKEYERIINRYKNIEDAREFAGDRKEYARRIRQDARAIRSAAVSPNRKKFVPEKYRENVERIAVWLDRVSVLGRNIHKDNASEAAFAFVRSDFQALTELFGDDFYSIASGLLGQMEFYASDLTQMESKDLKEAIFFRDAYKLGRLMRTSIANQNKVYLSGKNENATDVGSRIKDTLEKRKGKQKEFESLADKKRSGKGMKVLNEVYNKNLSFTDGYSFFHRMGKVGDSIFETLQGAQSRQVLYVKSYTDTISEKLKGVDLSKYAGAKQKTVSVTLESGKEFSMTAAQAMSAVTLFERENGRSHMEKGGIQIYDPKTRQLSKATALTEADIAALRNALDEEDKRVMKVFADFMRDECTAWGNEATMEKYGFHRFTTANYFPIKVNRDATGAGMKTFAPSQFNVENVGFAKSAKEDASAPVVIGSMIDVANAHVSGMATYAAYLNVEDGINRVLKVDGVKDAMRRALGSDAEKYITEMMNDLKGAGKDTKLSDNAVEVLNKMAGRYKAAAVSYNASTVAKQPLSYLRAAAVIGEKYLGKGVIGDKKQAFEQMMQYSGIAVRKEIGYSDVGVGKTVGDRIGYTEKGTFAYAEGKFNEFGMMGAAAADRLTWEALWIACRAEQAEKNASAALNNDALMQATAKRFAEVVARTQVVDSALTSAPVSRSGNGLVRLSYAFASEPIKNYNMLVTAIDDLVNADDKAAKSRAAKHIARVSVYTVIGWAIEAAITSAFQALRDDDDDFFGKFGETYLPNLLENTAGLLVMFDPVAETLKTKFQGYDVTSMADQPLADLVDNLIDLWDVVIKNKDGKRETEAKIIRDTFESISTLAGMPMKNLFRILTNARKALFHSLDLYKAEYNFQKFWYNPDNATAREKNEFNSLLADAYISGDKEAYEHIYEDMRKSGLKPQSLVSSIAKDAYAGDIADSEKSTLVKYTPGSDAWYIGMKTIFDRDENAPKATEDEITRVYKATGETSVLPKFKDGKYTVDGVSKEFEGASLDKYLEDYGRLYYEVANAMRDLSAYRRGSAEEQAWWLTKAERFASAVAVYTQDKDYSVTSVGKWVTDYIGKKPYEVAKYIVGNLEKK